MIDAAVIYGYRQCGVTAHLPGVDIDWVTVHCPKPAEHVAAGDRMHVDQWWWPIGDDADVAWWNRQHELCTS